MEPRDIDAVLEINREGFSTDAWSRQAFEREFALDYSHKFVLELNGQIIGYCILWVIHDTANIITFAIKRDHWGLGYGKRLLSYIIEKFKERVKSISLDVRKSNIRAIRLYRSLGFETVGERIKYYSDGENAYQMLLDTAKLQIKHNSRGTLCS